ncbi:uncharacterized protein LOC135717534 [Ochlerotatus camptorhynchus]|uniref:uncharacterized protein LOC135717534 n=1 Tax=Ochlerotatus camptorhynchus TaxID=644619 RepID=UPI0031DAEAC0
MNKSWKSFASLLSTPSPVRTSNKIIPRATAVGSSRVIAHLKRSISPAGTCNRQSRLPLPSLQTDAESKIEDASDDEEREVEQSANSAARIVSIVDCSAPSLDPNDVTICEKPRIESDIEDVSDDEATTSDVPLDVIETTSDDSDCEAIHCKREKRLKLDFVNRKSPRCGRRITDDIFMVANATARAATVEKSSTWIKSVVGENSPNRFPKTPTRRRSSTWKRLDESFKDSHPVPTAISPPNRKWKSLNESFRESPPAEIESNLTPEDSLLSKVNEASTEQVPETSFYNPTLHNLRASRVKYRKDCSLFRLQRVLDEKLSIQTFWLHERQIRLVPAKRPVKVESISKLYGRVAISYNEPDEDDPEIQIEHILYIDPGEKQLKTLGKGSMIEVEYDLEPHKLSKRKLVHLGVCKIKAVD